MVFRHASVARKGSGNNKNNKLKWCIKIAIVRKDFCWPLRPSINALQKAFKVIFFVHVLYKEMYCNVHNVVTLILGNCY